MKTLGRILIILIAVFVVVGATYAISQTAAVQALVGQPMERGAAGDRPAPPDFASGQNNPAGEMNGRPAGGREGGGGQIETLGRNLLKLGAIVVAVQVLWPIGRRVKLTIASLVRKNRSNVRRTA